MAAGIVIPAYNAERFLAQTLESVVNQTMPEWEMIVVDDGSADSTPAIAKDYASRNPAISVISQSNAGAAAARNAGARALSGHLQYMLFLDHDDVLEPDALEALIGALEGSPEAIGAHGLARKIDMDGAPLGEGNRAIQNYNRRELVRGRVRNADRTQPTTAEMVVFDNLICTPGLGLIRRPAVDRLMQNGALLFDPFFAPLDDWDFWLRLTRLGDLAFLDRVVLSWRRHESAGSQNIASMSAAEIRIRERLAEEALPENQATVAQFRYRKLLATRCRRAAREHGAAARRCFREGRLPAGFGAAMRGLWEYAGYFRLLRWVDASDTRSKTP